MVNEIKFREEKNFFDGDFTNYILKVYYYMCLALIITGATSVVTITFSPLANLLFASDPYGNFERLTALGILIAFSPVIISLYFFLNFRHVRTKQAQWLFWIYSALIGMSLTQIGIIYTGESIAYTFFICATLFGIMSVYGYTTQCDLTSLGSFMIMGLIGIIIASFVNLFLQRPSIYFIVSLFGIFIFIRLISWDTQKIKAIYYRAEFGTRKKIAILGALTLYLDIINLFLHLLKFLGKVKKQDK